MDTITQAPPAPQPVPSKGRRTTILIIVAIVLALGGMAAYWRFGSLPSVGGAVVLGQRFDARPGATVRVLGTDLSFAITRFDRPTCDPNEIGLVPCTDAVEYSLTVGGKALQGSSKFTGTFEGVPYNVEFIGSDFMTGATFRIITAETACEEASSDVTSGCWSSLARRLGDPEYCARIKEPRPQDHCWDTMAQVKGDAALCNRIADGTSRTRCAGQAVTRGGDPEYCETLTGYPADECWAALFKVTGEAAHCERVGKGFLRDACLSELAKRSGNVEDCDRITDNLLLRDNCVLEAAGRGLDVDCESLERDYHRWECWSVVAKAKRDPALCERVASGSEFNDGCWIFMAKELQDPSYCDRVVSEYRRENLCK